MMDSVPGLIIALALLSFLFWGTPDVHDGVLEYLQVITAGRGTE